MTDRTTQVLDTFAEHLRTLTPPPPVEGSGAARTEARAALSQLADHVTPRLASLDAPPLVVIGGSTGAGKSTLVNALVGAPVSRSGAIRPTTRRPVLLHHPADEPWFTGTRILPGLARVHGGASPGAADAEAPGAQDTTGDVDPATSLALHAEERIPQGLAPLDAPDIDSVAKGNRELARRLAARRGPVALRHHRQPLRRRRALGGPRTAAERDVTVDVVMNRIPDRGGVAEELAADLTSMLERQGVEVDRLFLVPETTIDDDGMLPPEVIAELAAHFTALAADGEGRRRIARRTLAGAVDGLAASAHHIAEHAALQDDERRRPREEAVAAFSGSRERIDAALGDGSLLRGEVLARWQDVVGTGEFFRGVESFVTRARDRLGQMLSGRPAPAVEAEQALGADSSTSSSTRRRAAPSGPTPPGARAPPDAPSPRARTSPGSTRTTPSRSAPRCAPGRATCSSWSVPRAPTAARRRGCSPSA
ncbi:dynamin family protein [Brachybacterium sp. GPGPB12]|uniref:dynamin family protein n=1 Tax=Brachybacterium sp. GPGPB12 TaxID=3023517 RepID=UPI0031343391